MNTEFHLAHHSEIPNKSYYLLCSMNQTKILSVSVRCLHFHRNYTSPRDSPNINHRAIISKPEPNLWQTIKYLEWRTHSTNLIFFILCGNLVSIEISTENFIIQK